MDAGIGSQLVEIFEAPDVADLGDEGGGQRWAHARNRLQSSGQLRVENFGHPLLRSLDLLVEEVELLNQHPDLKAHLGIQLGRGDGLRGELMESAGFVLPYPTPTTGPGRIGQRRDSLAGSCARRRRL